MSGDRRSLEMVRALKWLTDGGYDFSDPYAQVKIPDWVLKGEPNPLFSLMRQSSS